MTWLNRSHKPEELPTDSNRTLRKKAGRAYRQLINDKLIILFLTVTFSCFKKPSMNCGGYLYQQKYLDCLGKRPNLAFKELAFDFEYYSTILTLLRVVRLSYLWPYSLIQRKPNQVSLLYQSINS